jgi:hypothetical protein
MSKNDNSAPVKQADVDKLRTARAQIKKWQEIEAAAKGAIRDALGGKGVGTVRGEAVVTNTVTKQSRLNVPKLRAGEPEIAALYTEASTVETLRLVDKAVDDDGE